jgi:hypothetical protein
MALLKKVIRSDGANGEYWKVLPPRLDETARECSAIFVLYLDEDFARTPAAQPFKGQYAKLRLYRAQYDAWVSKAALVAAAVAGRDLYAQLYLAAKAVCITPSQDGHVICDFGNGPTGNTLFADAQDV